MRRSALLFLGVLAIFAGTTLHGSTGMPFTSGVTFGPGFLPLVMSVAVLSIGTLIAVRDLRRGAAPAGTGGDVRAVAVAVVLIAAAVAGSRLGSLMVPLGLCLVVVTGILLKRGWLVAIGSTAVTLAAIYAIFGLWLHIPIT